MKTIIPVRIEIYEDDQTRELSKFYDASQYDPNNIRSLGACEFECAARVFFKPIESLGRIVGWRLNQLERVLEIEGCDHYTTYGPSENSLDNFRGRRFLREEGRSFLKIVYPTQEFIKSQNVPKKVIY